MKSKRGQVSIFIILAVVLIAVGLIAYFISRNGIGSGNDDDFFSQPNIKQSFNQVQDSIFECQKMVNEDALETIGLQGGYYKEPTEYMDLGWAFIPYYYKEGSFFLPTKSKVESELGSYVDENIPLCLDTIEVEGFTLAYTKSKTSAVIGTGNVVFTTDFPITIKVEDKRTRLNLNSNPASYNSKLYDMYEIAKFITDSHREDPAMVCVSCVVDMARERNLFVDMLDYGDSSTNMVVISNNLSLSPTVYEFLNKYPVQVSRVNTAPL